MLILTVVFIILKDSSYLFTLTSEQVARDVYGLNPFPESIEIGDYIAAHTNEDDQIAVIGSEPQIYFYSKRRSATGYVYMYPMMEPDKPFSIKMQKQMITEIEDVKPKYLVYIKISSSWIRRPTSPSLIFDWFNYYQQRHYQEVGYVDMISKEKIVSVWDDDVRDYSPQGQFFIAVLKRK